MTDEIDFSRSYEYHVAVSDDEFGEIGRAKLTFGGEIWPSLSFERPFSVSALTDGLKRSRLIARTDAGESFTLFECELRVLYAHVGLVVVGEVADHFKTISIRYTNVSEWFLANQYLKGDVGESLSWENKPDPIDVYIKTDEERFTLRTDIFSSYDRSGEDHLINQHIVFHCERKDGVYVVNDVRRKCLELSSVISVLIAHPIDIVSIGLIDDSNDVHYAYFPHFKRAVRDKKNGFWTSCFIWRPMLDGRWQTIFENYYKSEFRKVAWARLAGMQRYDSFWEYKAFGYVSLLDGIVKKKAKGLMAKKRPPGIKRINALKVELERVTSTLTPEQVDDVVAVVSDAFSFDGRDFSWFYGQATTASDQRVMAVINISDADFSFIKKVRDAIAHGDEIDIAQDGLERVSTLVKKIILLLTYWAFIDFGLTADDFLDCMYRSHNSTKLGAAIDQVYLDRILGKAEFYTTSEERFKKIEAIRGVLSLSCFTKDEGGEVDYSEKYTRMLKDWMSLKRGGVMKPLEIFGVEDDRVKCSGTAYIECGEKRLALYHIYVIDEIIPA